MTQLLQLKREVLEHAHLLMHLLRFKNTHTFGEPTSASTTQPQQALKGTEKHNQLKDLGAQKVILPFLFHMQYRFEAA